MVHRTDDVKMGGLKPTSVEVKSSQCLEPEALAPLFPAQEDKGAPNPGSEGEHRLQEKCSSTPRAHAFYKHQVLDYLNPTMVAFIAKQEMMFVGTADRHGEADASFRAGEAGFVRILNPTTLAYPEYRGNGVMASLGNISENPHAGLLFVDFTERIGLHVNGTAKIMDSDEFVRDFVIEALASPAGRRPERWVIVSVNEAYIHCSKHIPSMQKIAVDIQWGTDDVKAKGGDYFKAKRERMETQNPTEAKSASTSGEPRSSREPCEPKLFHTDPDITNKTEMG